MQPVTGNPHLQSLGMLLGGAACCAGSTPETVQVIKHHMINQKLIVLWMKQKSFKQQTLLGLSEGAVAAAGRSSSAGLWVAALALRAGWE